MPEKITTKKYITKSSRETENLGKKVAKHLKPSDIVVFKGPFGSGKTTMIKGIVKHFTDEKIVTSPSFVLLNEYQGKIPIYHFDLYRITKPEELKTIGYEEYAGKGLVLIEWPEKIIPAIKGKYTEVNMGYISLKKRDIEIKIKKNK